MEWIKSILEKVVVTDGKIDVDALNKVIDKEAPKHVVPKEQYNTLSTTKTQLEDDIAKRDKQLVDLKNSTGDVNELQSQIKKLQDDNESAKKEYDEKVKNLQYDAAIEKALTNAIHPDLVSGKIQREKLKLNNDGTITGLDEQVTALKESYKDLFKPEKVGGTPNNTGGSAPTVTKEEFSKMGYLSVIKLKHDNPELYASLKGDGGNE
ncbi:MAG: phage scaffolding protein [Erysipelotrichaceae bacterium]